MANLKDADSALSHRIVLSFLDFLNSVEPISDCDLQSLEYAKDCLLEAFNIDSSSSTFNVPKSDSLVQIFSSQPGPDNGIKSDQTTEKFQANTSHVSSTVNDPVDSKTPDASSTLGVTDKQDDCTIGVSEDELYAQFYDAQEKAGLLVIYTPDEAKDKTRRLFNSALGELKKSGVSEFDLQKLADTFKLKGNKCVEKKCYTDAIGHYSAAIALFADNAVYYCNRAAAYTQTKQYTEAISDCEKAIEIDPSYSKAYSRLGYAYYAQGNFNDAIHKGFKKALQLDPDNEAMKGNIQAAEQKLMEEQERDSRSSSHDSANYPHFDLNDYPLASEEDRNMMKMMNEYNRRNHAIITEQGFDGVSDRQLGNFVEHLRCIGQMLGADSIQISTPQYDDNNNSLNGN